MTDETSGPPVWDLSVLYQGPGDPNLEADLRLVREGVQAFRSRYLGRVRQLALEPKALREALEAYERLLSRMRVPLLYAELLSAADWRQGEALERVTQVNLGVSQSATFFLYELRSIPEGRLLELAFQEELQPYTRFLVRQALEAPHTLSLYEEEAILAKNLSARDAWMRLYDRLWGALKVSSGHGPRSKHSGQEALRALGSALRGERESSLSRLAKALEQWSPLFARVLDALVGDRIRENRRRNLPPGWGRAPLQSGLDLGTVKGLLGEVEARSSLFDHYARIKARHLGRRNLTVTDLQAPWGEEVLEIPFAEALEILRETLSSLHPALAREGIAILDEPRIHALPSGYKTLGSFCRSPGPGRPSFISLHYGGRAQDLLVLAHELGHAIHNRLARSQPFLVAEAGPVVAESAAAFLEAAVARHLWTRPSSGALRFEVTSAHLDRLMLTLFRQTMLTRFEEEVYAARERRSLDEGLLGDTWMEAHRKAYGKGLRLPRGYGMFWTAVPHLFRLPFYCWTYVLGELLALGFLMRSGGGPGSMWEEALELWSLGGAVALPRWLEGLGGRRGRDSLWMEGLAWVEEVLGSFP